MRINREQAEAVLQPLQSLLVEAVEAAFRRFSPMRAGFNRPRPAMMATVMNNLVEEEICRVLTGVRGVNPIIHNGRFLIGYGGLILQFKKLTSDYCTSNYPTPTALRFDGQLVISEILAREPRLTVGYQLSRYWDQLRSVVVIYAIDNKPHFIWHLTGQPAPAQLPLRQQPAAAATRRVRAKGGAPKRDVK